MGKTKGKRLGSRYGFGVGPGRLLAICCAGLVLGAGFLLCPPARAGLDLSPDPDSGWFVDMKDVHRSAHAALSCEECHGDMRTDGRAHPDGTAPGYLKTPAVLKFDYSSCRRCHSTAWDRTLAGRHAEALDLEKTDPERAKDPRKRAPRCGDCHNSHYEPSHRTRLEVGRAMVPVCGRCHPAETAAYLENYHGRAAFHLGDETAAFCTDCHGAHTAVSLKDREAAAAVCRRCHAGAGKSFAGVVIHQTLEGLDKDQDADKRTRVAVIRTVSAVMVVLVLLVVVFFYGHSFLWLLRELHEKLRKRGS